MSRVVPEGMSPKIRGMSFVFAPAHLSTGFWVGTGPTGVHFFSESTSLF
jgi:hypothetical protein